MSNEELPGVWTLKRMDGQPINLRKVRPPQTEGLGLDSGHCNGRLTPVHH